MFTAPLYTGLIAYTSDTMTKVQKLLALASALSFLFASLTVTYLYFTYQYQIRRERLQSSLYIDMLEGTVKEKQANDDMCQTLHVAMIVLGVDASRNSYSAIKSVLIHRQDKIHFHFIADKKSQEILDEVFESWELPGVEYSFYDFYKAWSNLLWKSRTVQNQTRHMLEFMTPLLHLVLPTDVERVIVLDPHVVFVTDLAKLWSLHNKSRLIGLDINNSTCVMKCGSTNVNNSKIMPWQTQLRNRTGIVLLDLKGLRAMLWHHQWISHLIMIHLHKAEFSLSVAMRNFPDVYYNISCAWSVHASPSVTCGKSVRVFDQVYHQTYFNNILHHIHKFNGYDLRYKSNADCFEAEPDMRPTEEDLETDKCVMLNWEGRVVRRVHPSFLDYNYTSVDPYDVTLVGHGTLDRLHLLESISKHWDGPMSIALSIKDSDVGNVLKYIRKSPCLSTRRNISYHLMYDIGRSYPINPLRILAHKHVVTPYVFFTDLDFLPSFGMYQYLKDVIKSLSPMDKKALVVPAFETEDYHLPFPNNKVKAVKLMKSKAIQMFSAFYPDGHAATNYEWWANATQPYAIDYQWGYEPYIVTKTNVTSFDPVFVDRHHNKISHNYELSLEGFKFIVVSNGFLIHIPHPRKSHLNYDESCYVNRFNEWLYLVRMFHGVPP